MPPSRKFIECSYHLPIGKLYLLTFILYSNFWRFWTTLFLLFSGEWFICVCNICLHKFREWDTKCIKECKYKVLWLQDASASYDVNDHDNDPQPRYEYSNENKSVACNLRAGSLSLFCTINRIRENFPVKYAHGINFVKFFFETFLNFVCEMCTWDKFMQRMKIVCF